jgi:predicted amidohydrolase
VTLMLVAALQLCSTDDKAKNLATAARLLEEAADRGAGLAVLPEMFNNLGSGSVLRDGAEPFEGPTTGFAREQAARRRLWLVAGSFIEQVDAEHRTNTSVVVSPDGEIVATYRKVHLFDVDVPGAVFRESAVFGAGDDLVVTDVDGIGPVGLSICYDLRFPELYRILALRGAGLIVVPAAFTARTGPPHWEVLLRARAIENQLYVVAAAQVGHSSERLAWHGHSMIIDPWGTVLAEAPGDAHEAVVVADVDAAERERVRTILPSLANRRPDAYRWPPES